MSLDLFGCHAEIFTCTRCAGPLHADADTVRCGDCATMFTSQDGYLDLVPELELPTTAGLGPLLLQDPLQVARYEDLTRPAFLQVAAANWEPALTAEEERRYLHTHVNPAGGPILDIACGAGRWTRVFTERFGYERVIGLDMSAAMLTAISQELPGVLAVRANALQLPFADESLGAVNCSAALQIMPDPQRVIEEIGRCLRAQGTFTLATLTPAPRPVQRYFQRRQEEVFNTRSFDVATVFDWCKRAHLTTIDQQTPASFLLLAAEKRVS